MTSLSLVEWKMAPSRSSSRRSWAALVRFPLCASARGPRQQSIRNFGVKVKLNPVREILRDKRIILVDDSIVRGTTSRKIVHIIRAVGAKEIHVRITSPPIVGPCYYGIDTPTKRELIASTKSVEDIRQFIGADSLGYLSLESLLEAVEDKKQFCSACFTDRYPTDVIHQERQKELFGKNLVEMSTSLS